MSDCVKIEIVSQGSGLRRRAHPYIQLHFRVSAVHFVQHISDSLGVIFILQYASIGGGGGEQCSHNTFNIVNGRGKMFSFKIFIHHFHSQGIEGIHTHKMNICVCVCVAHVSK